MFSSHRQAPAVDQQPETKKAVETAPSFQPKAQQPSMTSSTQILQAFGASGADVFATRDIDWPRNDVCFHAPLPALEAFSYMPLYVQRDDGTWYDAANFPAAGDIEKYFSGQQSTLAHPEPDKQRQDGAAPSLDMTQP